MKNDKDEFGTILLKHVLQVYNLAKKWDRTPAPFPESAYDMIDLIFDFWCFNATFNNSSAIMATSFSGGENHRPWASNW